MASQLKLVAQALADKYGVSESEITDILEEIPRDVLDNLNWADYDGIVQEVLTERSSGIRGHFDWREFGGEDVTSYGFHPFERFVE